MPGDVTAWVRVDLSDEKVASVVSKINEKIKANPGIAIAKGEGHGELFHVYPKDKANMKFVANGWRFKVLEITADKESPMVFDDVVLELSDVRDGLPPLPYRLKVVVKVFELARRFDMEALSPYLCDILDIERDSLDDALNAFQSYLMTSALLVTSGTDKDAIKKPAAKAPRRPRVQKKFLFYGTWS
jgi:hypothetical protein